MPHTPGPDPAATVHVDPTGTPSAEATWTVEHDEPGPPDRRPPAPWRVGEVVRVEAATGGRPVPAATPGLWYRGAERASFVAAVIEVPPPRHILHGDEGVWRMTGLVRAATPLEAARVLAAEAAASAAESRLRRRADLRRRRLELFAYGHDSTVHAETPALGVASMLGAQVVPIDDGLRSGADALYVVEDRGVALSLTYNGEAESHGDNNLGAYILREQPLTPARVDLVRELRAEFEAPAWNDAGVGPGAARVLIEAGWTRKRAFQELGHLSLDQAVDALVLLGHPYRFWSEGGWIGPGPHWHARMTPLDAVRLISAGVDHDLAAELDRLGHHGVDRMLAVSPPPVPHHGTARVLLRPDPSLPPTMGRKGPVVTGDTDVARAWLARHPDYWWPHAVEVTPDVHQVHVGLGWSLWSDETLVAGTWAVLGANEPGGPLVSPHPMVLDPAPAHGLALLAVYGGLQQPRDRELWAPLLTATGHHEVVVEHEEHVDGTRTRKKMLIRHDYPLRSGAVMWLWEVRVTDRRTGGGEDEDDALRRVRVDGDTALALYRDHILR